MTASFLSRILALTRVHPALATMKTLDAYVLGPALARQLQRCLPIVQGTQLEAALLTPGPIHWLRPGGMGDWATLAPFIEGVRTQRRHLEDVVWVTSAAFHIASAYHAARSGPQVRLISPFNLLRATPPDLLLQTEIFHPSAWLISAMLRPRALAGGAFPDPRDLQTQPPESMLTTFGSLHPGIEAEYPPPARERSGEILVFSHGNHPSRHLPLGFQDLLAGSSVGKIVWFGPLQQSPTPTGWSHVPRPIPPADLIQRIYCAEAVVSPDSGPLHLAELLGTPVVGYFTSGEAPRWNWNGPRRRTVSTSFACSSCTLLALPAPCPHAYACVSTTDAQKIFLELLGLIGTQSQRGPTLPSGIEFRQ